jgi:outer membrane protein assembly factor BamA
MLEYESYNLLPSVKFSARLKYVGYKAYPFYGYNGDGSFYHHEWEDPDDPAYKTRMFYRIEKKYLRVSADLQDTIGNSKFQWHAGWALGHYKIAPVNIEKMNQKLSEDKILPDTATLFDEYYNWGIIREPGKDGGIINTFMAGIIYDSRNKLSNPDKGIFTELNIRWMPSFLSTGGYSCFSIGLIHKQYFTLISRRLIFAYRLWWNANLSADQPFYSRQLLTNFTGTEGYGGYSTIRGALMQRIVPNDFILGTAELRSRLVNFQLIKQNWYIGAVLFTDAGRILKPVKLHLNDVPEESYPVYFKAEDKSVHQSAGGGLKLAMNENFILSVEYAVPFNSQDGTSGLYLGLNYQF